MATTSATASSLHEHAVEAEKHLEALATGLGQAGASPETVDAVSQCAEITRQIVKALGKGQESTGDEEGPAEEAAPTEESDKGSSSIDQATAETQAAMQAAAAKRQ